MFDGGLCTIAGIKWGEGEGGQTGGEAVAVELEEKSSNDLWLKVTMFRACAYIVITEIDFNHKRIM